MKKRILLLSVLTLMLCLSVKAQSDDTDDFFVPQTDTTLITGKTINIYGDSTNNCKVLVGSGAFGSNNSVKGDCSYAFGRRNKIDRDLSNVFAVGSDDTVTASHSVCLGRNIAVSNAGSFAVGRYLSLSGSSPTFVVGEGLSSTARLTSSLADGLVVGFLSTKPTVTITSSPNNLGQNVTDKTGKVAIGDVTPTAKLHIKSDNGEDAGLILEPKQPNSRTTFIQLKDSYHKITVNPGGVMQIAAGNHNLNLSGNNLVVSGSRLDVGETTTARMVLATSGTPGFYCNANPSQNTFLRYSNAPSYAMRFTANGLLLRTAEYEDERNEITNWRDAVFVGIDGTITLNGKVGINTDNTTDDYALAVAGGVLANKVFIQSADDWPDYVFDPGYERMSLSELERYVLDHGHLPDVPSAEEMATRGAVDLAETQTMLLRKIEEMTLYVIELEKRIAELEGRTSGDTVRFTYDACGNRIGRTIEFSRMDEGGGKGGEDPKKPEEWFAELHDNLIGGEASLFPNPTDGVFTLALTGDIAAGAKAALLTLTGEVLSERTVAGTSTEFDLNVHPAGVYLLRLTTDRETRTWKVIKRN